MFLSGSAFLEFLYGVGYYIDDPNTWKNFSSTSRVFNRISRRLVAYKKNQFRILCVLEDMPIYVLPNGYVHGFVEMNESIHLYNTGIFVWKYDKNLNECYMNYFYRCLKIVKCIFIDNWADKLNLYNINHDVRIVAHLCFLCNKYHYFQYRYNIFKTIEYTKKCLDTEYAIRFTSCDRDLIKWERRMKIAKSILEYAKEQPRNKKRKTRL